MASASEFIYTIKAEYAGSADMRRLTDDLNKISQIKSFEKLSGDIARTEQAIAAAEKKAAGLKTTMEKTGTATATNAFSKAEAAVGKLSSTLEAQRAKLSTYEAGLKKSGIAVTDLAAAQAKLNASSMSKGSILASESLLGVRSFSTIKGEIASLNTAYNTLASSGTKSMAELAIAKQALIAKTKTLSAEMVSGNSLIKTSAKDIGSLFASTASAVSAVGIAAAAAAAGGLFLFERMMSKAVDQAAKMGAIERSFIAIAGSGKLAGDEMKFVQAEATKLGLDLMSTAEAYKGIWAASKGTALEGEATRKIFSGVAAASSALGLSAEQTSGALLAISQMMSKGKIQAEELRGQLGERIPGAFNLMAQAAGVTTAQLDKMLESGQVGIDLLPKFASILTEKYGAAAVSADSYGKSLQNLKNQFGLLAVALGESVTNNTFVIESLKVVTGMIEGQRQNIVNNRQEWMLWAKNTALSVLEFAADFATGIGSVYKGMERTAGVLNIAYAGVMKLGQGYQYLFEMSNRAFGDTKKAQYWAEAQKQNAKAVEDALKRASQDFTNADAGLPGLDKAAQRLKELKAELEKIPATYKTTADQMADSTKQIPQEMIQVGGVWQQVTTKMAGDTKTVGEGVTNLGGSLAEYERKAKEAKDALSAQKAAVPPIDTSAADASLTQMVEKGKTGYKDLFDSATLASGAFLTNFEESNTKITNSFSSIFSDGIKKFDGVFDTFGQASVSALDSFVDYWKTGWEGTKITAKSAIDDIEAALRELTKDRHVKVYVEEVHTGGSSSSGSSDSSYDGYARGGDPFHGSLRGYGGGDRRLILVEDGEHVIRKEAVRQMGHDYFQRFNLLNFPKAPAISFPAHIYGKFAEGGPIGQPVSGGESHNHFHFAGDVSPMSKETARQNVKIWLAEVDRQNRRRSG